MDFGPCRPPGRNHPDASAFIGHLLKRVNHQDVLARRIRSQRNPPDFSLAVFLVRDRKGNWVMKNLCRRSKSTPCLLKFAFALTGSHSNS